MDNKYVFVIKRIWNDTIIKVLDNNIYSIQSVPVKGHIKRGKYVSAHFFISS